MRSRPVISALIALSFAVACDTPFITDVQMGGGAGTPPPQSVISTVEILSDTTSTIVVGQSTQLTAKVVDGTGKAVPEATVSWSTNLPGVATVTNAGLVKAVGVGAAIITATSNGKSASARVSVVEPTSSELGETRIPVVVRRFGSGSGTVLVSSAVPLSPGLLRAGDAGRVRVFVEGSEQPIYVETLEGRHKDGSLRSLLIQFYQSLGTDQSKSGELVIGSARGTTDIAKPEGGRSLPTAALLPVDPNYLISTDIVGPTVARESVLAYGGAFAKYEDDFATWAETHWAAEGDAWENNYYDRALIYYAQWVRTGNPEYWERGNRFATSYRVGYLEANNYGTSAHWSQLEGLEKHYLLTGADSSRHAVGQTALVLNAKWYWDNLATNDARIKARMLMSYFLAWRINADGQGALFASVLSDALPKILATQGSDGAFRSPAFCGENANYMSGLLDEALIQYYTYFSADPAILPAITSSAKFLTTQWNESEQAFQYLSGECAAAGAGTAAAPDLNNMIVNTFAWLFNITRDMQYRTQADKIFAGGVAKAWLNGTKQFNEEYATSYRYFAYRQ